MSKMVLASSTINTKVILKSPFLPQEKLKIKKVKKVKIENFGPKKKKRSKSKKKAKI